MGYENIAHLLADLTAELGFPANVKQVLGNNEPLRMWAENLVNAFMANRIGYTAICIAGDTNILRKYCKHHTHGVCFLSGDSCQFREERSKGGDSAAMEVSPCAECGGDAWHREGCPNGSRAFP